MFVLNFIDSLNKFMEPFKKWIQENYSNPLMWLGLFALGFFLFQFTYSALQKEK